MDESSKLIYNAVLELRNDIKNINNDMDNLNRKIGKLEGQIDIALANNKKYDNLIQDVSSLKTRTEELSKNNDNNKSLYQSIAVGLIVFVASYMIKFIR